jgi:EmrB/QacA subfamily drug resistance transporter
MLGAPLCQVGLSRVRPEGRVVPPRDASEITPRELYTIIGALMLGMMLAALDQTIVSTALPTIVTDLHGGSHLAWVVVAYLLSTTVTTPMWGKLGDLYGRKRFFQGAIVIFLIGSALCGLAGSMGALIAFRAIQGIGGGGLMVGAQAVIGDIVAPKDRGRYAGWFGATFGTATVFGPFIGGVIVQSVGWQWVFYVNIPLGAIALVATAIFLPGGGRRVQHKVDYAGFATLVVAASALILFTSLGGVDFGWRSWQAITLAVIGAIGTCVFVWIERRAAEPILSPRLFANRVFSSASAIGFVVGFAMFGAMTFLPLYMQVVRGVSPTMSGLRLLPMMGGLLGASITTGYLVSHGWRYRRFPIAGTIVMTVGLALLATVKVETPSFVLSLWMFVLGVGLGLVMQVLITATQNAVEFRDLGAATAGANFFRSIGGSFGAAAFGAFFSAVLPGRMATQFKSHGLHVSPSEIPKQIDYSVLNSLSAEVRNAIVHAFASTMQVVYLLAVPFGLLAIALSLTLPEVRLRSSHPVSEDLESIVDTIG